MQWVFQESKLWDEAHEVDPKGKIRTIRARTDQEAYLRLPKPSSRGRKWILIKMKADKNNAKGSP